MVTPCSPRGEFTQYPCQIDGSNELIKATDNVTPVKSEVTNRLRGAIIAIETELGINPSATYTNVRARLDALQAAINGLNISGAGLQSVLDEGAVVRTSVTSLNFIGAGVVAAPAAAAGRVDITVTGDPLVQEQETIAVTFDGQVAFTLGQTPLDATAVQMYVNGNKLQFSVDYTVVGTAVTYTGTDFTLVTTDVVEFWYIVAGAVAPGGENLAQTLALGNVTGGTNITLSAGDTIVSSVGTVTVDDDLSVTGAATIAGKLTVGGLIDPTGLELTPQAVAPSTNVVWVSTDTPTELFFTDSSGTDFNISATTGTDGYQAAIFRLAGVFGGVSVPGFFDPPFPILTNRTIAEVGLVRRTAGTSGTTRVDVLVNGTTSIFSSDGVKPQVDSTDGDNAQDTRISFTAAASLSDGDFIDVELETVEGGSPEGLAVLVRFE